MLVFSRLVHYIISKRLILDISPQYRSGLDNVLCGYGEGAGGEDVT